MAIDFLKLMGLFVDAKNPKKELGWIYFDRESGAFVATDTRKLIVVTPKSVTADLIYDKKFPHYNTDGRDEYIDKRGIGFKYAEPDNRTYGPASSLRRTYPYYKRILPHAGKNSESTRTETNSMWATTIDAKIILDVFGLNGLSKALVMIDILGPGEVVHSDPARPIMYEVERQIRFGTGKEDLCDAIIQIVVQPVAGLK